MCLKYLRKTTKRTKWSKGNSANLTKATKEKVPINHSKFNDILKPIVINISINWLFSITIQCYNN
jgi:hypothetical protein